MQQRSTNSSVWRDVVAGAAMVRLPLVLFCGGLLLFTVIVVFERYLHLWVENCTRVAWCRYGLRITALCVMLTGALGLCCVFVARLFVTGVEIGVYAKSSSPAFRLGQLLNVLVMAAFFAWLCTVFPTKHTLG